MAARRADRLLRDGHDRHRSRSTTTVPCMALRTNAAPTTTRGRGIRATAASSCRAPAYNLDGTPVNTRVNQVSANGETLVGWMEDPLQGIWEGVVWNRDVPSLVVDSSTASRSMK